MNKKILILDFGRKVKIETEWKGVALDAFITDHSAKLKITM